jgi:16S rRNA (guanine527-N7)-methyltransferase
MSDAPPPQGRGQKEPPAVLPAAPSAAAQVFGDRLPLALEFARTLADTGVSHGLVGPREVPRLWDRHVLNCAVVHAAFPEGAEVADVGSGAGLPGLALAVVRPDLRIHLVEPLLRRTTWLQATVDRLGLDNCVVHRARAEEMHGELHVPYATARAVARIDKLARWTFPLLTPGGTLVALKGQSAEEELEEERAVLTRLGMVEASIRRYGEGLLEVPTVTMELVVDTSTRQQGGRARSGRAGARSAQRRGRGGRRAG